MENRVLLPKDVVPKNYDLHINTKLDGDFVFLGTVTIELDIRNKAIDCIQLHGKDIKILSSLLTLEGADKSLKPTETTYDDHDDVFSFKFKEFFGPGKVFFKIEYEGVHNDQMDGFYRGKQIGRDGEQRITVSTKFEPIACRKCMPCIDEPAQKATFKCSLEIDKGLTALGNMPEEKREEVSDTREIVHFEKSPVMSTYLLAFVVGEFDFVEAITEHKVKLRVYTPVSKTALGEFALHCGVEALDLYDEMFGKPFPLPKMDMIAITEFASGAMENWGLVTFRETALLIDDSASSSQKQRVATVVAHELAHMWFGNLVTMRWWDDLWLNEGFASWMQNYATDVLFPTWKLWDQFIVDNQSSALHLDALLSSHPIQMKLDRAQDASQIFDIISYQKGSCVVRLVNRFLGTESFKKGLKIYMNRHEFDNTETVDLWTAWEEASNKPINKVMASWTEQQGFPVITVTNSSVDNGECTLKLRQDWFLADGEIPEEKRWAIPMFVQTEKGQFELDLFTDAATEIKVPVGDKGWLKLNAGQFVPLHVNYTEDVWLKIVQSLAEGALDTIDICGLITDAGALVRARRLKPTILLQLLQVLQGTTSYPVWSILAQELKSINSALVGEKAHEGFLKVAQGLLAPAFAAVGWEAKKDDSHLTGLLRGLLIAQLVTFSRGDAEVLAVANAKFAAYMADQKTTELPAEYRRTVLRLVLANSSDEALFDSLLALEEKVETAFERTDIYLAIGFINSSELKEKALEWAISGKVKLQDYFYVFASVCLSGPEGAQQTWNFLKKNFSRISEMLKSASDRLLTAAITYSTFGFNSIEQAKDVEEFFKVNDSKGERKIAQIIEGIKNKARFKDILTSSDAFKNMLAQ